MEIEHLQLWARWLELQRDRVMAGMELEQEEAVEYTGRTRHKKAQTASPPAPVGSLLSFF